eukprot:TRINITY_DN44979_c0_g1_i1.p1 TRINITY_DN44979_c0_g1~~TRINITY_DN44979_c0_g1_i1.p1  ORF type:complete len:126 (+),score=8.53 TRINITY_DN44979_c0_g1_i1:119-496(+)
MSDQSSAPVWFQAAPDPLESDPATLSGAQIDRMQKSPWLRNTLRDSRLQELLQNIDSSSDPVQTLTHARSHIPAFRDFCMKLLALLYGLRLTGAVDPDGLQCPPAEVMLERMFVRVAEELCAQRR